MPFCATTAPTPLCMNTCSPFRTLRAWSQTTRRNPQRIPQSTLRPPARFGGPSEPTRAGISQSSQEGGPLLKTQGRLAEADGKYQHIGPLYSLLLQGQQPCSDPFSSEWPKNRDPSIHHLPRYRCHPEQGGPGETAVKHPGQPCMNPDPSGSNQETAGSFGMTRG